ncbi:MAG: PDZ domain-containing protein [Acidobacteriota bacterium]|nr:PDZ domain-containing protein [Acidobacteriota bacterium]
MTRTFTVAVAIVCGWAGTGVAAQPSISYRLSFPGYRHHEAHVELRVEGLSGPLEMRMARSSPGRYRLHEFARNIYAASAVDGGGEAIALRRPDSSAWIADTHDGIVVFSYTVYGDLVSGTYSAIDETHAHLNPPSVLVRPIGIGGPVEVRIAPPEPDWRIATQLEPTEDPHVFRSPSLDYLLDSPIEIGNFVLREWQQGTPPQAFRMAVHHRGTNAEIDDYIEMTRAVVAAGEAVFGELPSFDFGTYTFLVDYLPWADGDAMEHRNSTPLVSSLELAESAITLLETLSHEFFHVWNVERIRPEALEPFPFDETIHTDALWFAEGFTNYYDGLLLRRADLWSDVRFARDLTETIDRVVRSPGPGFGSPVDMSRRAAFRDRGVWVDPQNAGNTFLSYYFYGEAIGLALDLQMRGECGSSLDALMQAAWRGLGADETPYDITDIEALLGELCGADWAHLFFADHVRGSSIPDYAPLVAQAGFSIERRNPGAAWAGEPDISFSIDGAEITSPTRVGTPFYAAGVDTGDTIVSIDGRRMRRSRNWERVVEQASPGDRLELEVHGRAGMRRVAVRLIEDPEEVVRDVSASTALSAAQRSFRAAWLDPN